MTGPLTSGLTTASPMGVMPTLYTASLPTKMTTSVSGGGVTVVASHQLQPQPQTVQLTIPSATKVQQVPI
jgi:hypothetical protein